MEFASAIQDYITLEDSACRAPHIPHGMESSASVDVIPQDGALVSPSASSTLLPAHAAAWQDIPTSTDSVLPPPDFDDG